MNKSNSLGDRMKANYENRTRYFLPRRTYTIIRLDGKAFSKLTKNCVRPFDDEFMHDMDETAISLCEHVTGCKFAYIQSDEISLLLTDFDTITTDAWFDGNIQKLCSVSASIASAYFNAESSNDNITLIATFDSRVFTIPDSTEVENYFIWRQQDMERNSIQMVAQSLYPQKELHGKKLPQLHDMLMIKGQNWNDLSPYYKRGRTCIKSDCGWIIDKNIPIFTKERAYLEILIPRRAEE